MAVNYELAEHMVINHELAKEKAKLGNYGISDKRLPGLGELLERLVRQYETTGTIEGAVIYIPPDGSISIASLNNSVVSVGEKVALHIEKGKATINSSNWENQNEDHQNRHPFTLSVTENILDDIGG